MFDLSGIPSLSDTEGLANYMAQQNAQEGAAPSQVPSAVVPTGANAGANAPAPAPVDNSAVQVTPITQNQQQPQMYTSEQVQQLIAQARGQATAPTVPAYQGIPNNAMNRPVVPQQATAASTYTPQQVTIIQELIRRGVPLETIAGALNKKQAPQQTALEQRLAQMEQFLQQKQYAEEETAFVEKMQSFGETLGLSEDDLVTFGNKAMENGIDITRVKDVGVVFRALYPEQYAIRSKLVNNNSATSQIYGGASVGDAPKAMSDKYAEQYAEEFLRTRMPNQWFMGQKK